jgi:rhodanese-related sulfurtransferase
MFEQITPAEFVQRRETGENLLLLDVRVDGAVHIPMAQVPERIGELDRDRPIVVMCHSGGRSQAVVGFLHHKGFEKVANLAGGIARWSREVDPSVPLY